MGPALPLAAAPAPFALPRAGPFSAKAEPGTMPWGILQHFLRKHRPVPGPQTS